MTRRCAWAEGSPLYRDYHDNEWGKPQFDSRKLFEKLCLEGQQAGLSWITVLQKRENYRQAFCHFDPQKIAQMTDEDINQCMQNPGLIRHRAKLEAIVKNAKAYLAMEKCGENFSGFQGIVKGIKKTQSCVRRSNHLLRLYAIHGVGQRSLESMPLQIRYVQITLIKPCDLARFTV